MSQKKSKLLRKIARDTGLMLNDLKKRYKGSSHTAKAVMR